MNTCTFILTSQIWSNIHFSKNPQLQKLMEKKSGQSPKEATYKD